MVTNNAPYINIEIGVATYEGDLQTWFSAFIDIPDNTPEEEYLEVATQVFQEEFPEEVVAGTFLIGVVSDEE